MKTSNIESQADPVRLGLQILILGAFLFVFGCDSQVELDKNPDQVEKRRQDFIQQSEREADEALPVE